jgi:hypothetical protein
MLRPSRCLRSPSTTPSSRAVSAASAAAPRSGCGASLTRPACAPPPRPADPTYPPPTTLAPLTPLRPRPICPGCSPMCPACSPMYSRRACSTAPASSFRTREARRGARRCEPPRGWSICYRAPHREWPTRCRPTPIHLDRDAALIDMHMHMHMRMRVHAHAHVYLG